MYNLYIKPSPSHSKHIVLMSNLLIRPAKHLNSTALCEAMSIFFETLKLEEQCLIISTSQWVIKALLEYTLNIYISQR